MTLLHLATGSPSGFLRIVEPFSLAEWHDIWMPWDAHGATWQMVKWCYMTPKTKNLHMLHKMCCSVLGRSDSELVSVVSVVSVLRLAKQIFCLRISFGVSIRYCPACRCDSVRLDTLTCQTQLVSLSCLSTQKTQPGALYRVLPSQS